MHTVLKKELDVGPETIEVEVKGRIAMKGVMIAGMTPSNIRERYSASLCIYLSGDVTGDPVPHPFALDIGQFGNHLLILVEIPRETLPMMGEQLHSDWP